MKIDKGPGAIPEKSGVRLLNLDEKDNLHDQIDEWLEQGMIEPSANPWASRPVPMKKKDGQARWVTDLRELNKQMVKDSYPLTNFQEILHSLQGTTMFSVMDACGAYNAARIKPGSRACTAFISPLGMFQYIPMLFGLAKAGSVYSRMLFVAMKEVDRDFWTSYLEDILILSGEPWAHFRHLAQVVRVHTAPGIKIQPFKTKLFQSEVKYLGHKINKCGVSIIRSTCRRSKTGRYQRVERR